MGGNLTGLQEMVDAVMFLAEDPRVTGEVLRVRRRRAPRQMINEATLERQHINHTRRWALIGMSPHRHRCGSR